MKKSLSRALPWDLGVDPKAITAFLKEADKENYGLHSLIVMRHGSIAAEGWVEPMKPQYYHHMFSLTKSFTCTAVGFAVQEKLLSVDDYVVSFFSDMLTCEPCENMKKMKVRHLLGMCTGHDYEDFRGKDPVEAFLKSYVAYTPGSYFMYNTPASHMLSAIVQKVTGEKVSDYLKPRLFDPLGFGDYWWECDDFGRCWGGFGLNLQSEDIAKFGKFLLQKGCWEGKQLLCSSWIEEASRYQMHSYSRDSGWPLDWQYGYGWQFWRSLPEGSFRADGAFGQSCIVLPNHDAVIVYTAGARSAQLILSSIWKNIVPGLRDDVKKDEKALEEMTKTFMTMRLPVPKGKGTDPAMKKVSSKTYTLSSNPVGVKSMKFDFSSDWSVEIETKDGKSVLPIGYDCWKDGLTPKALQKQKKGDKPDASVHGLEMFFNASCSGAWEKGKFTLYICYTRTPQIDEWVFDFDEKGCVAQFRRRANKMDEPYTTIFGRD